MHACIPVQLLPSLIAMASRLFSSLTISFFLLLPFSAILSYAYSSDLSNPVPPETICRSTRHPSFCKSLLPNRNANVFHSGRFFILKSLLQSRKFSKMVDAYLQRKPSLSQPTIRALEDCKLLAGLSVDFLQTSYKTVNKTSVALSSLEVDDVQTLLSAILTNQQTCLDGIVNTASDSSIKNDLLWQLSNYTKLHGVSLALFTKGWVPMKKYSPLPKRKHHSFRNGCLPLKMNSKKRAIYELVSKTKLLQTYGQDDQEVKVSDFVIVCKDGYGNFTTINEAIDAAPNNTAASDGYFLIYITAGVYQEYVSISENKKYLLMIGEGINQTIITGNRSADDGWTTFNSATFAVVAPGFVAVNITFRNTAGAFKHQAVALRSGADVSTFYRCSFEGYQATLYTHSLRQFYRECDIYGTIDFIFGNAAVVLQNCNIYPRLPMSGQFNTITAQSRTDPNQNTGISVHNCTIRPDDNLAVSGGTTQTYLGRPWKDFSRTVYMQSFMDSFINPAGWHEWSGSFALNTLYYAEYGNRGPGSNTANRVTWLGYHVISTSTDAANFTVPSLLDGDDWLPETGVPFSSGLI